MNNEEKLLFCLALMRQFAMSYSERVDRVDTPLYVLADEGLNFVGDDVDSIHPENDKMNELMRDFREWRRRTDEMRRRR